MTPDQLAGLAPLVLLALGAVAALMLAPIRRPGAGSAARWAAAAGLAGAVLLVLQRAGAPPAPVDALFADDGLARFGIVYAGLSGLAALAFMGATVPTRETPALIVLTSLGAAVIAAAGHGATLFLGLEIVTLSLVALFAFALSRPALEAAYKLLVISGLASAALLLGLALVFAAAGTLTFSGWKAGLDGGGGLLLALGAALLLAGLAFKLSLAPFHMWTPDAFAAAPPAAAMLAGVASKTAVAIALLRLALEAQLPEPLWTTGLAVLAGVSILFGNLAALMQPTLRRMLGYSTIAHSGYAAAIVATGVPGAPVALLVYLAAYAPALVAAMCLSARLGPEPTGADLAGLVRQRPMEGGALVLGLLSLAGLPLAGGFIAKLFLFKVLIEGQAWVLLAVAVAGSGLGFWYYARFLVAPFRPATGQPPQAGWPPTERWLLVLCSALLVLVGLWPNGLIIPAMRAWP